MSRLDGLPLFSKPKKRTGPRKARRVAEALAMWPASRCCVCQAETKNRTRRWPDNVSRFACPGECSEVAAERIEEKFGMAMCDEIDRKTWQK